MIRARSVFECEAYERWPVIRFAWVIHRFQVADDTVEAIGCSCAVRRHDGIERRNDAMKGKLLGN